MREYGKSEEYFINSLKIQEISYPENHPDLATTLNNLGSFYNFKQS